MPASAPFARLTSPNCPAPRPPRGTGAKKESLVKYRNGSAENPQISVIIPAKNEAQGIGSIIGRVRKALDETGRSYEIIVVDDGSTDATAQRAHEAGATVLCHPYNIGNGAAIKTGIRYARGFRLVMLDADGQHPPEEIPALLEMLEKYHMVVGARIIEFGNEFSSKPGEQDLQPVCLIRVRPPHRRPHLRLSSDQGRRRKGVRHTSAQHLFLPDDDNPGHSALRLQPRLLSDNEPKARSGHQEQNQAPEGRITLLPDHFQNNDPVFAHEDFSSGQHLYLSCWSRATASTRSSCSTAATARPPKY